MLGALVAPLGLAVGWARLAGQLRRSSVAIVSAREEERRRLRRDLHDGLGPALTGVSLGVHTAVRQLERSPDAAAVATPLQLLGRIAEEVDALIVEVKRIVRDLRPTALDQFGLVAAVGEFTRSYGDVLEFRLTMPATPVDVPAAVEAATYRIVTEAVTNVVRHAQATRCWLTIAMTPVGDAAVAAPVPSAIPTGVPASGSVEIDVIDDGVGVAEHARPGVGWTAMRERAGELGGTRDDRRAAPARHAHPRPPPRGGAVIARTPVIRVAIVDDHPLFRLGLTAAIAEMDSVELVGEAQRADQVADLVATAAPTVVLLDIGLPDASGLEVNRWLAANHPTVRVVMLTMSEDLDGALIALRDGACGYLVKGAGAEQIEHALRAVASGEVVVDHSLVQSMTELVQSRRAVPVRPFPQLTDAGVRHPRARRRGAGQRGDRPAAGAQPEDGAQPRLQRVRQDPRARPAGRDRARPSLRARDLTVDRDRHHRSRPVRHPSYSRGRRGRPPHRADVGRRPEGCACPRI